jgi:ferredoxin
MANGWEEIVKIVLDRSLCDANAVCVQQAPDFFALDDDEELRILKEEVGGDDRARVERAVESCPKAALRLIG